MGISVIIFVVFSIYRGMRATFALSYAVEKESFTKENFKNALEMVDGKWWRVFWNFFLVGIIGGLITSLVTNLTNAI
jgi:membrane-anchored glycerophosphoryl diester phosphodiesterase (GDPDase)